MRISVRWTDKIAVGLLTILLAACSNLPTGPHQTSQSNEQDITQINRAIEDAAKSISNPAIKARLEILRARGTNSQKTEFVTSASKEKDISEGATYSLPAELEALIPQVAQNEAGITIQKLKCIPSPPDCEYIPVCVKYFLGECTATLYHKSCQPAPCRWIEEPDFPCKPGKAC